MKNYKKMNTQVDVNQTHKHIILFVLSLIVVLALGKSTSAYATVTNSPDANSSVTNSTETDSPKVDIKKYGIMIANEKGGYTHYDLNDGSEGNAAIELTAAGSVMVPLKELTALIPGLTYRYDATTNKATITNKNNGKKIVFTKESKYLYYYSSSKAKAIKKTMVSKMYLSDESSAVMVHMQSLKWVMGTTGGFVFYKPAEMQAKGYDTYTYSGLILYNSYKAITELPIATKVYGIPSITKITIPEGYSVAQTFDLLVKKGVCTTTETLYDAMENYYFSKHPLVIEIEENVNRCFKLEGYLYPDTYDFYLLSKPEDVIAKFLRNINVQITDADKQKAKELGYSINQILTVASMIEKETADKTMMSTIASVIYNRLNIGMKLQFDSSIYYVERYIKPYIDGDINRYSSYYNTYKCAALPAGPISNPGRAAIQAALNPAVTDYLYFYSDAEKVYHFSKEWVNSKALDNSSEADGATQTVNGTATEE